MDTERGAHRQRLDELLEDAVGKQLDDDHPNRRIGASAAECHTDRETTTAGENAQQTVDQAVTSCTDEAQQLGFGSAENPATQRSRLALLARPEIPAQRSRLALLLRVLLRDPSSQWIFGALAGATTGGGRRTPSPSPLPFPGPGYSAGRSRRRRARRRSRRSGLSAFCSRYCSATEVNKATSTPNPVRM